MENSSVRKPNKYTNFQKVCYPTGYIKVIECQCCPRTETSQLICCANHLTGFYMRATLAFNGLKHLYLNNCRLSFSTLMKGFRYLH